MLEEGWFGPELRRGFINAERGVVEFPEQFKESIKWGMQVKCGEVRKQGSANCGNWHSHSHPLTIDLVYLHQHHHWPHPCCCNMRPTKPSLQSSLTMPWLMRSCKQYLLFYQHCEWQSSVLSALWVTTQGRQETANREGPCVRIGATRNRPPQIYFLYSVDSWPDFCTNISL